MNTKTHTAQELTPSVGTNTHPVEQKQYNEFNRQEKTISYWFTENLACKFSRKLDSTHKNRKKEPPRSSTAIPNGHQ